MWVRAGGQRAKFAGDEGEVGGGGGYEGVGDDGLGRV